MRVKIRGYIGEIFKMKGYTALRDGNRFMYNYSVRLLVDQNTTIELINVRPNEIEVLGEDRNETDKTIG